MASTYTTGFGIEKIGSGEQSGAWGTTTNHNLDILDRIASYKAVALSGTTHTLTVREASPGSGTENLQDGMYRVIKFTGALGGNNTVTIAPNTAPAYFIFENATTDSGSSGPYSVILTQGSGANITIQNGKNAIVYCDGAGSGAAVVNALSDLQIATLEVTGAAAIDGALTAAAITGTTLTTSGIVSVDDTTTSTSGTTGSIHTDGGLGVAGTAFVAGTAKIVGVTTHGDDVVSDTDSTDDLGTTGVRWANLFVDGITATDQITATGFTGTLDGILGSGAAAAATVTTLTTSGIVSVDDTTTSTSGTTGSIHTDGGLGVAGTAFVAGAATVGGASQFNSTVTVGVNDTGYDVKLFGATSGSYMLWDESTDDLILGGAAQLGIGTTAPAKRIHIESSGAAALRTIRLAYDGSYYNDLVQGGAAGLQFNAVGGLLHTWAHNGTEIMRLNATGLGIGTTAPANKLDVVGNGARSVARGSSTAGQSWLEAQVSNYWSGSTYTGTSLSQYGSTASGTTAGLSNANLGSLLFQNGSAGLIYSNSSAPIVFGTSGTERVRIDGGNVMVGKTSAGSYIAPGIALVPNASSQFSTNTTSGNMQLSAPVSQSQIGFYRQDTGALMGYVVNGASNTLAYNTSSDYRLKENIVPMSGALAKVALLKPCTFTWKSDEADGQGFIAHELQEVVPDAASGEKDAVDAEGKPRYQGVDTSFLVATLTAAIQEQQALIEALTNRITALEG